MRDDSQSVSQVVERAGLTVASTSQSYEDTMTTEHVVELNIQLTSITKIKNPSFLSIAALGVTRMRVGGRNSLDK